MKGYAKINTVNNMDNTSTMSSHKSRSIDFSDLPSFPQTPKSIKNALYANPAATPKAPSNQSTNISNDCKEEDGEEMDQNGSVERAEVFGNAMLRRNCSVSSAYGLQSAVKRVFSMRRSSSVSERYCRIHDQSVTLASPIYDYSEEQQGRDMMRDEVGTMRSANKKKQIRGSTKIIKACKRFLGIY